MVDSMSVIASYGALGVCCIYFMCKDWIKSKETDKVIGDCTDAIKEFTAAANLCNRNGSVK